MNSCDFPWSNVRFLYFSVIKQCVSSFLLLFIFSLARGNPARHKYKYKNINTYASWRLFEVLSNTLTRCAMLRFSTRIPIIFYSPKFCHSKLTVYFSPTRLDDIFGEKYFISPPPPLQNGIRRLNRVLETETKTFIFHRKKTISHPFFVCFIAKTCSWYMNTRVLDKTWVLTHFTSIILLLLASICPSFAGFESYFLHTCFNIFYAILCSIYLSHLIYFSCSPYNDYHSILIWKMHHFFLSIYKHIFCFISISILVELQEADDLSPLSQS